MLPRCTLRCITLLVALLAVVGACAPATPDRSGLQAVTAVPTLDYSDPEALCTAAARYWERDWELTLRTLLALYPLVPACADGIPISTRLYQAYLAYGEQLETERRPQEAAYAYQQALNYDPQGAEASAHLLRLTGSTPQQQQPDCPAEQVAQARAATLPYTPGAGTYVRLSDNQFTLAGQPFTVYGANYYPRDYALARFLAVDMDLAVLDREMALMQSAGLNTLRIPLRYDVLFQCAGAGAVPVPPAFARLDALIASASAHGFKLILVLNDAVDLSAVPLYSSPPHNSEQTAYLVARYAYEPAIMAWDLRAGGDRDYTGAAFPRATVLNWLQTSAMQVRAIDRQHLITAGWDNDAAVTQDSVDFVSFQHFGDSAALRQEIASLRASTGKLLLLAAFGYSTYEATEAQQLEGLQRSLEAVTRNELAGWVVWMAFDYPLTATCNTPNCIDILAPVHRFGLWNTSYFPKLGLDAVRQVTGAG